MEGNLKERAPWPIAVTKERSPCRPSAAEKPDRIASFVTSSSARLVGDKSVLLSMMRGVSSWPVEIDKFNLRNQGLTSKVEMEVEVEVVVLVDVLVVQFEISVPRLWCTVPA